MGEANASLASKTEAVTALEQQIATLKSSLDAALADVNAKAAAAEELLNAKSQAEAELAGLKQTLVSLKAEHSDDEAVLKSVQNDVCAFLIPSYDIIFIHLPLASNRQGCERSSKRAGCKSSFPNR